MRTRFNFVVLILVSLTLCSLAFAQDAAPAGVGIQFKPDDNGAIWVQAVLPGSPAEQAGIKAGDEILAIEGKSVADLSPQQFQNMVRGEEGTSVTLTVRTKGAKPRKCSMQRERLNIPAGGQPQQQEQPRAEKKPDAPAPRTDQPAHAAGKSMRFKRVGVNDPGINNIEACHFLVPVDWNVEGGIKWFPDYSILANLLMRITDPDTGAQIEFLPAQNFTYLPHPVIPMQPGTNYMGNIVCQPITDLNQFVQTMYAPQALPHLRGLRPVNEEQLPKVEQTISQNYGGQSKVKAGRVRYEFNHNGQPWEEDIYLAFVYSQFQENVIWSVVTCYSFRAPKGKLDELTPVMMTTINTYRLTEDWYGGYMYVQKLFMNRMNQGIANAKALSDTITKNSEEIRKMFADSYKQQQDSQDRISQSRSETMRGVETYKNPYEDRPVELPSGYNDAWVNNKGEYILSNEAGYDPNVGDTSEWRRMDRRDGR